MTLHQSMEGRSLLFLSGNTSASSATVVSYKLICDQHYHPDVPVSRLHASDNCYLIKLGAAQICFF